MGVYETYVVPCCIELGCGIPALEPFRRSASEGLYGSVLEIGFGSGMNVPYYPSSVREVLAVDPSRVARWLGRRRIDNAAASVETVCLDAESIQLDDARADCALSTFTLCTIPHPERALAEIRRVLKPGGRLHFLEHGLAPDAAVARWQERLTPLQRALFGGCRLDRPIARLLERAGFRIEQLETSYLEKAPRTHGYLNLGVAVVS